MTDFVEQMMKIAGIKPYFIYHYKLSNVKDEIAHVSTIVLERERISHFHKFGYGKICKVVNCGLPDFTAEKQLELIKLIVNQNKSIVINSALVDHKSGFLIMKDSLFLDSIGANTDFTQALAQLTTKLMKAGELDKGKVKEILEG